LGAAILAKKNPQSSILEKWMKNNEVIRHTEKEVNKILREKFSFRYVIVDDKYERLELEERLIATLAEVSLNYASPTWLGHYSPNVEIRESGLWNVQYVHSNRHMEQEHLRRLEQLVHKTLLFETGKKRALILIPCCKTKTVNPTCQHLSQPLYEVVEMRNKLIDLLKATPALREKPENKKGVLNPDAPITGAVDLYNGRFYKKTKKALLDILGEKYPHVRVLIVSALYGLVKLDEGIKEYELTMTDKLANRMKVYRFWQKEGLWRILLEYIHKNQITHIWSLLPGSLQFPYHQVFLDLWKILKNTPIKCIRVEVPGAGSATGCKRGKWLTHVIKDNPLHLITCTSKKPHPGNLYKYSHC